MNTIYDVIGALAAIALVAGALIGIGMITKCEKTQLDSRERMMMECARNQCQWIGSDCLCGVEKKK